MIAMPSLSSWCLPYFHHFISWAGFIVLNFHILAYLLLILAYLLLIFVKVISINSTRLLNWQLPVVTSGQIRNAKAPVFEVMWQSLLSNSQRAFFCSSHSDLQLRKFPRITPRVGEEIKKLSKMGECGACFQLVKQTSQELRMLSSVTLNS